MRYLSGSAAWSARLQRFGRRGKRAALGLSRRAVLAMERWRQRFAELEIRLEGLDEGLSIRAVEDVPAPKVDMRSADLIAAIAKSSQFAAATAFFADNPVAARSLVSPHSQALLYCLVRNLRPEHVFEIGCYRAGTTEAICRALHANNYGTVHATDPFCGDQIRAVLRHWPHELRRRVEFYPVDSMAFYMQQERRGIRPGVVFVDGNHDYEYALFDIGISARIIAPGGFIFIDNVAQAGPFFAGRDFLAANPGWRELGGPARGYNRDKAYDRQRTAIVNTDFMVLQAPAAYWIDDRPRSFGQIRWSGGKVAGLRLKLVPPVRAGMLNAQVVLRGFGAQLAEATAEAAVALASGQHELSINFTPPAELAGDFNQFRIEPWLIWRGDEPLQLLEPPAPY